MPLAIHLMCMSSLFLLYFITWYVLNFQRTYDVSISSEAPMPFPSCTWVPCLWAAASCLYFVHHIFSYYKYTYLFGLALSDAGTTVLEDTKQSPVFSIHTPRYTLSDVCSSLECLCMSAKAGPSSSSCVKMFVFLFFDRRNITKSEKAKALKKVQKNRYVC